MSKFALFIIGVLLITYALIEYREGVASTGLYGFVMITAEHNLGEFNKYIYCTIGFGVFLILLNVWIILKDWD